MCARNMAPLIDEPGKCVLQRPRVAEILVQDNDIGRLRGYKHLTRTT
jgi:hypothetical protein